MQEQQKALRIMQALSSRAQKFETHFASMKPADLIVDVNGENWCVRYPDHEGISQWMNFTVKSGEVSIINHTGCFHDSFGNCPSLFFSTLL